MKHKYNFDNLFEELQGQFDVEEPNNGHQNRFLEKIKDENSITSKNASTFWKPFLAIAASLVICLSVFGGIQNTNIPTGLASVSPELSEAQDFFTSTIREELKKLDAERSPLTEHIIHEAERQLKTLEDDYAILKNDLKQSGNDKRVIHAMIANFQNRIDILTNILDKIDDLKDKQYETENTL